MFYKRTYTFLPLTDLAPGDVVWVKWEHSFHGDIASKATATVVVKVYDDGNIIHQRPGYDMKEFAWAHDVFAKSPPIPLRSIHYRTVSISEVLKGVALSMEKGAN